MTHGELFPRHVLSNPSPSCHLCTTSRTELASVGAAPSPTAATGRVPGASLECPLIGTQLQTKYAAIISPPSTIFIAEG
jgi:hypothetical protein